MLSSCSSVHKQNFTCDDARGASCFSVDVVDQMITNGDIKKYTEEEEQQARLKKQKQVCKGLLCPKKG